MREKLATRQRGVSHDRDATITVIYLLLAFALDFSLFRLQMDAMHFPWLLSQALGLALIVTLGIRFWFVVFISVFANGYFIWHEGRSVTSMFIAIITTACYTLAAGLWHKLRASSHNTFVKSALFALLGLCTCGLAARLTWSVLIRYELIDPIPARIWVSQLTVRDTVNLFASFPFFALIFVPFLDHLVYRGTGRERQSLDVQDILFATLPFFALALPRPPDIFESYLYLIFVPAMFIVYHCRIKGAVTFAFAVHLWLYQASPFDDLGVMDNVLDFQLALMLGTFGTAYLFDKQKTEAKDLLAKKEEELNLAHSQIADIEDNRREWRSLSQTLERLVIRSTQDLRSPLTPIYMWSRLLKEDGSPQAVHDASDGIQLNIERQTKMLEELRDSVRISMGHQMIRRDTFDLADLLCDISEVWKVAAAAKQLEFRYERPLEHSLILGDREQLCLALQKLFEHLIQFGKNHAVISLHASTQHRDVILHLKHSGYSSDQQHVLNLLQAGQGMDPEDFITATNFDVALYTAKKLIDLQGGRLTAASLKPKAGMLFSLSLKRPNRNAKASPAQTLDSSVIPPTFPNTLPFSLHHLPSLALPSPSKHTMLIVEDDRFTLNLLKNLLSAEGMNIVACHNAMEAIEAFHRVHPNLVLADLGLPDINGFELVRRLKKTARHEFIAVAFSACVTPEAKQQTKDAGFSAFLAKPLEAKELLETMRQLQVQYHPVTYQSPELDINPS